LEAIEEVACPSLELLPWDEASFPLELSFQLEEPLVAFSYLTKALGPAFLFKVQILSSLVSLEDQVFFQEALEDRLGV